MSLRVSKDEFDRIQQRLKRTREDRGSSSVTESQSNSIDAIKKQNALKTIDERVIITFIVYRHKLIDPDNNYSKHFTDAIVESGLLRNDTSSEIEEVRYRQVKIPEWEQERTVIELIEVT